MTTRALFPTLLYEADLGDEALLATPHRIRIIAHHGHLFDVAA